MITLYTWTPPNGRKPSILLEELGMKYEVKPINIGKDEQFHPDFLKVAPNNKIPAIIGSDVMLDGQPLAIFESSAILTYFAEKSGRFLAPSGAARFKALQWLHWKIGGLGPMLGQLAYFAMRAAGEALLTIDRFTTEVDRLLGVMEQRLEHAPYLAGSEYSIADIACYPWMIVATTGLKTPLEKGLQNKPAIDRWLKSVGSRPAVQRGMNIPTMPPKI